MPETTAITRREYRGYSEDTVLPLESAEPTQSFTKTIVPKQNSGGDTAEVPAPAGWEIMQAVNEFRKQIYSSFMAVTLILSGLDRQWLCDGLKDSSLQLSISQQNLNPKQIENLVCYSASFRHSIQRQYFPSLGSAIDHSHVTSASRAEQFQCQCSNHSAVPGSHSRFLIVHHAAN